MTNKPKASRVMIPYYRRTKSIFKESVVQTGVAFPKAQ